MLYTLREIAEVTGGTLENASLDSVVSSVSIDSREIASGALFVAIAGDRFDGHDFVAKALEAGSVAAIVAGARRQDLPDDLSLITVADPLDALGALAWHARSRSAARIVAVTGSVGKTSTKEALRTILSAQGPTHASVKSFNNHWGVPLTLSRMPEGSRYGVFEIGMNHAGEITPLVAMVRPHVAVVTAIGEAHLEFLGSLDAIADAKGEIFSGLEPGGVAIINADHAHLDRLVAHARERGADIVTYGVSERADVRVMADEPDPPRTGISGLITGAGRDLRLTLMTSGVHTLVNSTGALLAARAVGVDPQRAAAALAEHRAGAGRGALLSFGPADRPLAVLDESYNANPASVRAALSVLGGLSAHGEKILVLGDMRQLGAASARLHAGLAEAVLGSGAGAVYLVGTHMAALAEALPPGLVRRHCRTAQELTGPLLDSLAYGDVVMVKGSNGERLGAVVEAIASRFGPSGGG